MMKKNRELYNEKSYRMEVEWRWNDWRREV